MSNLLELDINEQVQVGRDPRKMEVQELNAAGFVKRPILSVIRDKCLDCCAGNQAEVKRCTAISCALWPYRMNSNPFVTREYTDEQREAMKDRLAKARVAQ